MLLKTHLQGGAVMSSLSLCHPLCPRLSLGEASPYWTVPEQLFGVSLDSTLWSFLRSLRTPCSSFSCPQPKGSKVRKEPLSTLSVWGVLQYTVYLAQPASSGFPVSESSVQKALLISKFMITPKFQGTYVNSPKNCKCSKPVL